MNWKRIFRNTLLVLGGLVALLFAVEVVSQKSPELLATKEVKEMVESRVTTLNAASFSRVVEEGKGKPQLYFVYASWCPYCKQQFRAINLLNNSYGADKISVHYVSTDDSAYALAKFLTETYPEATFTPYHVDSASREGFYAALTGMGFSPRGSVPYTILIDKDGKAAKQFSGLTELKYLLENVEELL